MGLYHRGIPAVKLIAYSASAIKKNGRPLGPPLFVLNHDKSVLSRGEFVPGFVHHLVNKEQP
jgi:hypothetical protein